MSSIRFPSEETIRANIYLEKKVPIRIEEIETHYPKYIEVLITYFSTWWGREISELWRWTPKDGCFRVDDGMKKAQ